MNWIRCFTCAWQRSAEIFYFGLVFLWKSWWWPPEFSCPWSPNEENSSLFWAVKCAAGFIPQIQFFTWILTGERCWTLLLVVFKNYLENNCIKTLPVGSVVLQCLRWVLASHFECELFPWQNKVKQWDLLFLPNIWLRVSLPSPCFVQLSLAH